LKKERDENVGKNSSFLSDTQYYFGMKKEWGWRRPWSFKSSMKEREWRRSWSFKLSMNEFVVKLSMKEFVVKFSFTTNEKRDAGND
jgi:hypothetical protein